MHEHPATALNWKEGAIEALARHPMSKVVIADQCRYGLVTTSEDHPTQMMPAMKPTKFLTNSEMTASQLQNKCQRDASISHLWEVDVKMPRITQLRWFDPN